MCLASNLAVLSKKMFWTNFLRHKIKNVVNIFEAENRKYLRMLSLSSKPNILKGKQVYYIKSLPFTMETGNYFEISLLCLHSPHPFMKSPCKASLCL